MDSQPVGVRNRKHAHGQHVLVLHALIVGDESALPWPSRKPAVMVLGELRILLFLSRRTRFVQASPLSWDGGKIHLGIGPVKPGIGQAGVEKLRMPADTGYCALLKHHNPVGTLQAC